MLTTSCHLLLVLWVRLLAVCQHDGHQHCTPSPAPTCAVHLSLDYMCPAWHAAQGIQLPVFRCSVSICGMVSKRHEDMLCSAAEVGTRPPDCDLDLANGALCSAGIFVAGGLGRWRACVARSAKEKLHVHMAVKNAHAHVYWRRGEVVGGSTREGSGICDMQLYVHEGYARRQQ